MQSDEHLKYNLIGEINAHLEHGDGTLSSIVRKAARLAHLCGDSEHRMLFDMHLNGINPNDLSNVQIQKWPSKDIKPKWDFVLAFKNDRALTAGNIVPLSLENLEFKYEMLKKEMDNPNL